MSNSNISPFSGFKWYRMRVVLRNVRLSSRMLAHPFSVFQAIVKTVSSAVENKGEPVVFFHLKDKKHTFKMREGEEIPLEIFFFNCDLKYVEFWREIFGVYLSDSISGGNFEIAEMGEVEKRSYELVEKEFGKIDFKKEICLEFLSPFPFKRKKDQPRTYLSKADFIRFFEKRFSRLLGREILYEKYDDDFSILPYYWNYTEIKHSAKSQPGQTQYIKGCVGKLYLKGDFKNFLPFLVMGAELHLGGKLSNSQGYYQLLTKDNSAYFQNHFPDKKAILSVMLDVLERYDEVYEALEGNEGFSLDKEKFAEKLVDEINNNTYQPSPNTAFVIRGKLVEKLNFKDLVVQQYLAKTVAGIFKRIFEENSLGFKKSVSGKKAIDLIQSAISEKYCYLIRAKIENVFSSVDPDRINNLLDFYFPQNDLCLKNMFLKSVQNGHVLNGTLHNRKKGLVKSSPLSPLLADLYLDSFDKKMNQSDAKIIRSGDDFIILARSKEDAQNIFSQAEYALAEMFLKVKKVFSNAE